jgi:hypothetical protein
VGFTSNRQERGFHPGSFDRDGPQGDRKRIKVGFLWRE